MPPGILDYGPNEGVIKSGLCATPAAQDEFDATEAGRPPG